MKRTGFKPRKTSMRAAYAEKMREEGRYTRNGKRPEKAGIKRNSKPAPKPRSSIRKVSKSRASEMRLYREESKEFLNQPQHRACAICLVIGETPKASTEVHHFRGRNGRLLRDQRFWIPSCRSCRDVPHDRPNWARDMGILGTATEWQVYPGPIAPGLYGPHQREHPHRQQMPPLRTAA